jgi:repressor LexA
MPLKISKPTNPLTPRQLQLLKVIHTFQVSQCFSPTIAELASELNIARSTVFEHIAELRRKDLLSASPARARSLNLTSKALKLLNNFNDPGSSSYNQQTGIPLAGKVAAGSPIEAIEDTQLLSLSSHFGTSDDIFALEVKGDSMAGADIRNGDFVICQRRPTAENGQLVIAVVDEKEATLKRFYKEKSCARLQPANDDYEPIYSDNCRIQAVVIGLLRKF